MKGRAVLAILRESIASAKHDGRVAIAIPLEVAEHALEMYELAERTATWLRDVVRQLDEDDPEPEPLDLRSAERQREEYKINVSPQTARARGTR